MSPRTRTILAWVLFAVGTLVILVGSLTLWVRRQALDTDSWVKTSSQLLEDDDVRAALSVYIVDQLYANAEPQEVLEQQLPENLQGLAGPIAGALRQPAVEGDREGRPRDVPPGRRERALVVPDDVRLQVGPLGHEALDDVEEAPEPLARVQPGAEQQP